MSFAEIVIGVCIAFFVIAVATLWAFRPSRHSIGDESNNSGQDAGWSSRRDFFNDDSGGGGDGD